MGTWPEGMPGVVVLPDGRRVRGRSLRHAMPHESAVPEFGLYLSGRPLTGDGWESRWIRWPDFGLPASEAEALEALREVHRRAEFQRVEVACGGGSGRTGAAIALLARMAGCPASEAVEWTRAHYRRRAIETPWQRRFVVGADVTG